MSLLLMLFVFAGIGVSNDGLAKTYQPNRAEARRDLACLIRHKGESAALASSACFPFSKPREFWGVWNRGLEASYFVETPARPPNSVIVSEFTPWLEFMPGISNPPPQSKGEARTFLLHFIARISTAPGAFGSGGVSPNAVIVDRLLSAKPLSSSQVRVKYLERCCS